MLVTKYPEDSLVQGLYGFIKIIIIQGLLGQFLIFQGLKITEVQGSAILTHIFLLYKAHVTAQETVTCSTETALGRKMAKINNSIWLISSIIPNKSSS